MARVTLIPVFAIKPGRLDDFKVAAARLVERTASEPGTLRYEQFLSDDGTRVVNIEVFADADAFIDHSRNVADLVPPLLDAGPVVHIDVIGDDRRVLSTELAGEVTFLRALGSIERSGA